MHAILRAFTSNSALLHAAERRGRVRNEATIDANNSGIDLLCCGKCAANVTTEHIRRQTEDRVIRSG